MSPKRPAGRAERRIVDRDGVVEVRDGQGDRAVNKILLALVAALAVAGTLVKVRQWITPAPATATQVATRAAQPARTEAPSPLTKPPVARRPRVASNLHTSPAPDSMDPPPSGLPAPRPSGPAPAVAPEPPAREGIAVFPAPGTKRIKTGIIVPEDFPLPPGYVRHYQATDKGRMLPAILMFHPDHPPVDADGNPIDVPEDRIVPPEMVPAGLPIETLQVPKDAYADREQEAAEAPR